MQTNFINYAIAGLLNDYINAQTYRAVWTKLSTNDPKPGMRGGHQMVLDPTAEMLYLFGGWDGNQDLSDLWVYNIPTNKWTLICKDTESVVSPQIQGDIFNKESFYYSFLSTRQNYKMYYIGWT